MATTGLTSGNQNNSRLSPWNSIIEQVKAVAKSFLERGNGHQIPNRKKALAYVLSHFEGATPVDGSTIDFPPYGRCHFAAYTHEVGAMISTPGRADNSYGSADWHHKDKIMMFRDFGDGRCVVYVSPIQPLFDKRTIGHHGVRWEDVHRLAEFKRVFRPE